MLQYFKMNELENYRQLKPHELLRPGDKYVYISSPKKVVGTMQCIPVGGLAPDHWPEYRFYRRRHTAKNLFIKHPQDQDRLKPEKKLVVTFYYPSHSGKCNVDRKVQVIDLNDEYLTGLEMTNVWETGKNQYRTNYQFKKFLRTKIKHNEITVESYQ